MKTPASIKGHPLHPMLIPLPLGLWIFSWIADLIWLSGWGSQLWQEIAFYTLGGGLVGAFLAAIPGLMDYLSLTDSHVKKIGTRHLTVNLIIIMICVINVWMRADGISYEGAFALSTLNIMLLGLSGWLGGELVYKHGVAVDTPPVLRTTGKR
ncbi:MAG TPA: DUF2231 domain-containing protein [Nitrospirales bacterium]|nr:DUF2231 domain-containing protein [Nitrospirales bacterium]